MAVATFDGLLPHVLVIREMEALCPRMSADEFALAIALDALEVAAYHFTRRPRYYDQTRVQRPHGPNYFPGLGTPAEAVKAFERLRPYAKALSDLEGLCPPFRRDWLALEIAVLGLDTAAYHFTRVASFYGAKADAAGLVRPAR